MNILRKLKRIFKNATIKPYTHYKDQRIQYITKFKKGYALALIAKYNISKKHYENNQLFIAVVDKNYNESMDTSYHSFGNWYNDYLISSNYSYPVDSRVVLLDSNLKEIPNIRYSWISIQSNYLEVKKQNDNTSTYGLLDKNLELILPEIYLSIKPLSKSRFFCKGEQNIVFDAVQKQTFEIKNVSDICTETINGWYIFCDIYGAYGYFDNNFNIVIKPKYTNLGKFNKNGFATFERNGIIGLIDRTGKEFIQ